MPAKHFSLFVPISQEQAAPAVEVNCGNASEVPRDHGQALKGHELPDNEQDQPSPVILPQGGTPGFPQEMSIAVPLAPPIYYYFPLMEQ